VRKFAEYDIGIYRLDPGIHEFQYEIGEKFFASFENSMVDKGSLQAKIVLNKRNNLMEVEFVINGTVALVCDRSLEPFDHKIELNEHIVFKFGDHDEELDDDLYMKKADTQSINMAAYLYEFIMVAIPFKKLHPRYRDEEQDEIEFVFSSLKEEDDPDTSDSEDIDPRWTELLKLKRGNNKNN